jgi:hypothetical protein
MKLLLILHSFAAFFTLINAYKLSFVGVDEGNKDFGNVVVFFDGDDCKPSNIMQDGAAFVFEDGCWTGNYGSYEVWDLWKVQG